MHIIVDKTRLERVLPIVRDRGPAAWRVHFLRLEARAGELTISGLAAKAVIPAVVEEPGVLFIRAKLLRSLVEGLEGETLDCRVTEEAFMLGNLRLPLKRKSLVYFPDPAQAPRVLPGADSLEVRYGAVGARRKSKGAKASTPTQNGMGEAAMPLFDKDITQGFELRPPRRAVTRRLNFPAAAKGVREPAAAPPAPTAESPSISAFSRDQLKEALLEVVGTDWMERDDAVRLAARYLGFGRTGKRIQAAFKSAINGLKRQNRLESAGTQVRRAP